MQHHLGKQGSLAVPARLGRWWHRLVLVWTLLFDWDPEQGSAGALQKVVRVGHAAGTSTGLCSWPKTALAVSEHAGA